jgi:hypothetical protein
MKKFAIAAIACALSATAAQSSYVDLVSLNASGFTVDVASTSAPYTQTVAGLTYGPTLSLGDTLGGLFNAAPLDWSAYSSQAATAFAVKISIAGTNPNLPFSLTLFDSTVTNLLNFSGTTVGATTDTYVPLTLVGVPTPLELSVLGNVGGMQFTWDGGASANVTTQAISAVPEPSTYAMLALAALGLGAYRLRRRN